MLGKAVEGIGVSIHAPAGGATNRFSSMMRLTLFQFTLPRGERPTIAPSVVTASMFQFTLPRGERPRAHRLR